MVDHCQNFILAWLSTTNQQVGSSFLRTSIPPSSHPPPLSLPPPSSSSRKHARAARFTHADRSLEELRLGLKSAPIAKEQTIALGIPPRGKQDVLGALQRGVCANKRKKRKVTSLLASKESHDKNETECHEPGVVCLTLTKHENTLPVGDTRRSDASSSSLALLGLANYDSDGDDDE
jgi:hypothetical protein